MNNNEPSTIDLNCVIIQTFMYIITKTSEGD